MRHPGQPTGSGPTPTPSPASKRPHLPHTVPWPAVLDALREAGAHAGVTAAEWWAQDTIGGRASGDTSRTARAVLAGLDDGDPAICDTLPACDLPGHPDDPHAAQWYDDTAPFGAPAWETLDAAQRAEALDAYRDGFATTVEHEVAGHCHNALDPTGVDRAGTREPGGGSGAGAARVDGQHPEHVALVHTPGLRLPHARLAVTSLQQMPTYNGVAFVADLALDGRFAGRIQNEGNGGGTAYFGLNSSRFNHQDLSEFAAACRRDDGQPIEPEWLLDALVNEYDLGRQVSAAAAAGATVARLLDEAGLMCDLQEIKPRPVTPAEQAAVTARLAARAAQFPWAGTWQLWDGTAWRDLPNVAPTR
jgi:hypothetical protein